MRYAVSFIMRRASSRTTAFLSRFIAASSLHAAGCTRKQAEAPAGDPAAVADAAPRIDPNKTHVIFLIIDTLRADKMGAYGFDQPVSPELDRFAKDGVRFDRAIAQCSWTRPSIGSMLTGIYPRTLGLYKEENQRLGDNFLTLAEVFKKNGYTTLGVTANPNINAVFGFDQGFDAYIDSQRIWPWMKSDLGEESTSKAAKATYPGQLMPATGVFEQALELIDKHPTGPYFMQINIMEMHGWGPPVREELQGTFQAHKDGAYLDKLRQASIDVGAFVDRWMAQPGFEDTLLVITSDHGEGLSDHPDVDNAHDHGLVLYESQLHVPLILYHSKGALGSGVVIEQPVRIMDIFPTIADLLGFGVKRRIDGVSLKDAITKPGSGVDLPPFFVAETYFQEAKKQSVYSASWNFYNNMDGWKGMDPTELQQAGQPELGARSNQIERHPGEAEKLEAFLRTWERQDPKADPLDNGNLPDELIEQLRAIGYLD